MAKHPQDWYWKKGLLIALVVTLLHHSDHVLRQDHSGWPFNDGVTPFTLSLLIYPLLAVVFWLRQRKPNLQAVLILMFTLVLLLSHILVEPPTQQYNTWASNFGTVDPGEQALPNKLDSESPLLGVIAVIISLLANFTYVALTIFLFLRARKFKSLDSS